MNKLKVITKENGTSLIEVLLSVALVAIIVTPLLSMLLVSFQNNNVSKEKTEAIALAEKVMSQIKSQKVILPTTGEIKYNFADAGSLIPYYKIEAESGNVPSNSDTQYNYDAEAANNPDFELTINQGENTSDGILASVILKYVNGAGLESTLEYTNINVDETFMKLIINKTGTGSTFFFGNKLESEDMVGFKPLDPENIKLKVTYTGDAQPSSLEQLKIFTCIDSDMEDVFKIYETDTQEANTGVSFINKGVKDFEVIYMDTHAFNFTTTEPLNQLFKIKVIVKKNGSEIYKTSSYVKK